jgi:hypothetical protein
VSSNNSLFLQSFLSTKQDSRLRKNDGISYFSGCLWGFANCKGFRLPKKKKADAWEHLLLLLILRQPENQAVGFSPILAR